MCDGPFAIFIKIFGCTRPFHHFGQGSTWLGWMLICLGLLDSLKKVTGSGWSKLSLKLSYGSMLPKHAM